MAKRQGTATWAVVVAAACVALLASTASATVSFTNPLPGDGIVEGDAFDIQWIGGDGTSALQLWHGWGGGWELLDPAISDIDGQYTWDSTGAETGTHTFHAWVNAGGGNWYFVAAPNTLDVVGNVNEAPVALLTPAGEEGEGEEPSGVVTGIQGEPYDILWDGGGSGTLVQLWRGWADGWEMLGEFPADNGGYEWETTDASVDVLYTFAAWVKPADNQWYYVEAPAQLLLETEEIPEPMTMTLLALGATVLVRRRRRA